MTSLVSKHFFRCGSTHISFVTRFHITWLPLLPEMDCWSHIPLCTSFRTGKSGFCSSFSSDTVKATSGRLVPLNSHGFVVMVCSELGLHKELTNSALNQFGVI